MTSAKVAALLFAYLTMMGIIIFALLFYKIRKVMQKNGFSVLEKRKYMRLRPMFF